MDLAQDVVMRKFVDLAFEILCTAQKNSKNTFKASLALREKFPEIAVVGLSGLGKICIILMKMCGVCGFR